MAGLFQFGLSGPIKEARRHTLGFYIVAIGCVNRVIL